MYIQDHHDHTYYIEVAVVAVSQQKNGTRRQVLRI